MAAYFAYGANLDHVAMSGRCPGSVPLAHARLDDHRFFIMADGYASVRHEPGAVVHGLLWRLHPDDLPTLDRFEDVAGGLYEKVTISVESTGGAAAALVYVGRNAAAGTALPGYMEAVLKAAAHCGLPDGYRRELEGWLPGVCGHINR